MKAFGVRLAAGAVTVAMGAIMAAQAQKDQQPGTDSAWTEEQIPPGQAVSPIGSANALVSTEDWDTEVFKPIGDAPSPDAASGGGVALVQHTEPTAAMALPTNPPDADAKGETAESSGSRPPLMTMSLPNFDDAPPLDTQPAADTAASSPPGAGGPSVLMGLPMAEAPPSSVPDKPKLSEIKFADTPVTEFNQQADTGDVAQGNPLASDPPANDLRGGVAMPDAMEASGPTSQSSQPDQNFPGGSEVTGAAAGVPAALLTPVLPGGEQTELAEGSESTMRIHGEPPVQLKIGAEPTAEQSAAVPSARMGITSQPQIVGQYDQPVDGANDHGQTQAVGGFAAPANNGFANQSNSLGPQSSAGLNASALAVPALAVPALAVPAPAVPALSVPALPSSARSTSTFDAPPMQSQATQQPGTPSFAGTAPPSGDAIYQGVGFKQSGGDRPLPAGPTMASPGERYLDGPQAPSIVIHKRAPAEVKVGKPASFVITVKNVGGSKALDVNVHDRVPTGMTLTDATPRPNPKFQPELFWELGDLEPNQERTITLQLTPEQEGELGSVARVTFQAAASVRTISTRPELKIAQKAPEKVLIGQQLEIELEVSNPGTGEATGVILQEDVPAGLEHPQGGKLDNLIGTLGPGEIRRQILRMRAIKPGIVQNQIRVKGDDGLETTHTVAVEVIAPELKVSLTGPSRRYLERQATYNLELANVGTADATNVELSVQLDRGFTFVKTDFEGQYDSARHAVFWSLPALPVGQSGKVPLTLLPVEEGDRVLRTEATADLGIKTSTDNEVRVESLAELSFSINDSADPIEVGGETTYEIRITNSGSKDDTNVNVAVQLPQGLKLVEQGDFTPQGQGIIKFSPRALLKANDEMVYQVKAQGITPGRYLVKAIVTSDQSNVPVTKEESIMVYSDQ